MGGSKDTVVSDPYSELSQASSPCICFVKEGKFWDEAKAEGEEYNPEKKKGKKIRQAYLTKIYLQITNPYLF